MQPQFQQQQMPMDFPQPGAFGHPQQPFGFVPGPMPPPWAFNGAYQQFPHNPAYGMQSNQWLASQQPGFQQQSQQPPVQQQQQQQPHQQQQQPQTSTGGDMMSKPKNSARGKKKLGPVQQNSPSAVSSNAAQMSYTNTICMCCGEPGHHQAACGRTPMCFICKATTHLVDECPVKKRPHQLAKYVGSGAPGLGFYHIEMLETVINPVGSTRNCDNVIIE
jgi:hypothetical protein